MLDVFYDTNNIYFNFILFYLLFSLYIFIKLGTAQAKLKKSLKLKYWYKNAALLLLWIAFDIHKNPGPVGEAFSTRIRPILEKICSKLLKIYIEFTTNSHQKNIWTQLTAFYLYDYKTECTYHCDYKSLKKELLIDILLVCCEKKGCNTDELANEIIAWKHNDFNELFSLHNHDNVSKTVKSITSKLERIKQYADPECINQKLKQIGIELNDADFFIWLSIHPTKVKRKKAELCWEACYYITSVLCKIANQECAKKTYEPPKDWPTDYAKFKDPHNQKQGQPVKVLFNDLSKYCCNKYQENKRFQEVKPFIAKCEEWITCSKMQDGLLHEYVLNHDVAFILEQLQYLQNEGFLHITNMANKMLLERGIKLLTHKWTPEVSQKKSIADSRVRL